MTEIAVRWFMICYLTLGISLITLGVYLLTRTDKIVNYLLLQAKQPEPPYILIQILKFLFIFSFVCLFFSFFPFTWVEFLFSVWLLIILFTIAQFMVHWKETSRILLVRVDELSGKIRFTAANMVSLGIIMFLLYYQLVV